MGRGRDALINSWRGVVRYGEVRGEARQDAVRPGEVGRGRDALINSRHGLARWGEARSGKAWLGQAWFGGARQGRINNSW